MSEIVDPTMEFRRLDLPPLIERIGILRARIDERFPERNLKNVCGALEKMGLETEARIAEIRRPMTWLRVVTGAAIALFLFGAILAVRSISHARGDLSTPDLVQVLDAVFNEVVLISGAFIFLARAERRMKQRETLRALDELRSLAHVVDVHQLTKDPDRILHKPTRTAHSPHEDMTPDQLVRYLNYSSEMLALIGKLAAVYAQQLSDSTVIGTVTEIEALCSGLSREMWQKIMIVHEERRAAL